MTYIGSSTVYSTEWVVERMRERKPESILDIGCGWGRWGFLAREFLELWEHNYQKADWKIEIDAMDVHEGTWTPAHEFIYDHTYTMDVREWTHPSCYDLVIACDVLEHIPKDDSLAVIAKLRESGSSIIVGVPIGEQWPHYDGFDGNDFAGHVCHWFPEDFPDATQTKMTQTEDKLPYGLFYFG